MLLCNIARHLGILERPISISIERCSTPLIQDFLRLRVNYFNGFWFLLFPQFFLRPTVWIYCENPMVEILWTFKKLKNSNFQFRLPYGFFFFFCILHEWAKVSVSATPVTSGGGINPTIIQQIKVLFLYRILCV